MPRATVTSRLWTETELQWVQENPTGVDQVGRPIPDHHNSLILPKGGILTFASTQPKKIDDAKKILGAMNANVTVIDPIEVLHWFLAADEVSKTFIGNAYEKAQSILDRVYGTLGYGKVAARFRERGIDPSKVIFCVNDCGAYFNTDYSHEPEFQRSLHEKGLGPWPGVEFSPVTDAQGGLLRFFTDLRAMVQRKEAAGEKVDLSGRDHQSYLFFKLEPLRQNVKIFSFEAAVPIEFTTKPSPADDDVLTSFHFSKAADDTLPEEVRARTRADLGDSYLQYYSAEAQALSEFVRKARIPQSYRVPFNNYAQSPAREFYIASQSNVIEEAEPSAFNQLPESLHVETRKYDIGHNGSYQQLTRNADAVVLGPHCAKITSNWDSNFLPLFDFWSSMVVDKQVRVETFEGKPFVVLNRKNPFSHNGKYNGDLDWNDPAVERHFLEFLHNLDPQEDPWQQFILFTRYLHEKGFVKQEPRFLFKLFEPNDPRAMQYLEEELADLAHRRINVPHYTAEEYGQDDTGMFEVSVLGSASTRVAAYTEDAFNFGYWGASQGWHMRGGGGRYGVMGHMAEGVFRFMEDDERSAPYSHFSAIQMPRTLQFEGVSVNPAELKRVMEEEGTCNKYLLVAPGFDSRMRSIFRSHANVAMAPGMGTYQEITHFCLLAERNDPIAAGKKIILVNQEQPGSKSHIRLMDPFLAICPPHIREKHMIVVPDLKTAKAEVLNIHEQYLRAQDDPQPRYGGLDIA